MKKIAVMSFTLLACFAASGWASYEVTDLGVFPGGIHSLATGINSEGVVCGTSDTKSRSQGFTAESDPVLKPIPHMNECYGISDGNVVVGMTKVTKWVRQPSYDEYGHRIVTFVSRQMTRPSFFDSKIHPLGTLGGDNGCAFAIQGNIAVGIAERENGNGRPVRWDTRDGRAIELFSVPGGGWAKDINKKEMIVGTFFQNSNVPTAFLWFARRSRALGVGYASAINDNGTAVGYDTSSGKPQAILWRPSPEVLPPLNVGGCAIADDINNMEEVIGESDNRAVIWQNGQVTDLNDLVGESKWLLTTAMAINDNGQIACRGQNKETKATHALLLSPVED